ncbi:hypothetical protein MMYC01_204528 [Madurella mycetomatis]|uniref:Uncharacterized protein n=1 Tax=Madurella mycetomatis TaxID=100816 RepID=A0A175W4H3_9PEZI|nr:hypothetical protein MMYC01_204528 [Madurella mycetomatis]
MARSIDRAARASNIHTPVEWKEQLPHKWCGKMDAGRKGKPNKTQKCDDCLQVKRVRLKMEQKQAGYAKKDRMALLRGGSPEGEEDV